MPDSQYLQTVLCGDIQDFETFFDATIPESISDFFDFLKRN